MWRPGLLAASQRLCSARQDPVPVLFEYRGPWVLHAGALGNGSLVRWSSLAIQLDGPTKGPTPRHRRLGRRIPPGNGCRGCRRPQDLLLGATRISQRLNADLVTRKLLGAQLVGHV